MLIGLVWEMNVQERIKKRIHTHTHTRMIVFSKTHKKAFYQEVLVNRIFLSFYDFNVKTITTTLARSLAIIAYASLQCSWVHCNCWFCMKCTKSAIRHRQTTTCKRNTVFFFPNFCTNCIPCLLIGFLSTWKLIACFLRTHIHTWRVGRRRRRL